MKRSEIALLVTILVGSVVIVLMGRELRGKREVITGLRAELSALKVAPQALPTSTTAASAPVPVSDAPPEPWEDPGACPFEGCVYREWKAKEGVDVHIDRNKSSPIGFQLAPGESVTALTGVVVTIRAGRVRFKSPQILDASPEKISISPEQTLYLLTYQGEGYTMAWFNGKLYKNVDISRVIGCEGSPARPCLGEIVEPKQVEWWAQVRNKSGQVGWAQVAGNFGNMDAVGD